MPLPMMVGRLATTDAMLALPWFVALVAGVSNTPAATINLAQTLSSIAGNVKYGVYSGAGIAASTGPFALSCQFPLSHVRVGLGVLVLRPA